MNDLLTQIGPLLAKLHDPWTLLGFFGQGLFMSRLIVQWFHSEKAKRSVMPSAFWTFSLLGGLVTFCYAVHQHDPVFEFAQGLGLIIYSRNVVLLARASRASRQPSPISEARRLIDQLQSEIHKVGDLQTRPTTIDQTVERLRVLINTTEAEAA